MVMAVNRKSLLVLVTAILLVSYLLFSSFKSQVDRSWTVRQSLTFNVPAAVRTTLNTSSHRYKHFLYLVQTESCIPQYLRAASSLGNSSNRDIIVLSYKTVCHDTSLPHITYIFNSSTTWATGRSHLYLTAKALLHREYLYYIIMDDDVRLEWMNIKPGHLQGSPWRAFEDFLLENEPPLAATDNTFWQLVKKIFAKRKSEGCIVNGTNPEYFLAVWFDGMFNAFHNEATQHILEPLLPFWNRFDNVSWWFAQWYVNMMADLVFHGQAMIPSHIMGTNPVHRSYPKKMHDTKILHTIAEDVKSLLPPPYRNAAIPLLNRWETEYVDILKTVTDTYCHPLPMPHPNIVPFEYFYRN